MKRGRAFRYSQGGTWTPLDRDEVAPKKGDHRRDWLVANKFPELPWLITSARTEDLFGFEAYDGDHKWLILLGRRDGETTTVYADDVADVLDLLVRVTSAIHRGKLPPEIAAS